MFSDAKPAAVPGPPRNSATVVLLREQTRGSLEVFLMRRHRGQSFMGGAHVFPGGRLDEADCGPALLSRARDFDGAKAKIKIQEPDLSDDLALGLFFCAVRELFEEAGVLLACDSSGRIPTLADSGEAARFSGYRHALHEGKISLSEIAEKENLRFPLDRLLPYSHWITPEIESKRFNTRFFLARLPEGQAAVHDDVELIESVWLSPAAALAQNTSGKILLMPPTLKTLEELKGFSGTDALFAATLQKRLYPILPQAFSLEGGFGVKLPHDPEYAIAGYRQPPRPGESSRVIFQNGRWRAA